MSGGSFNYDQYKIQTIADDIAERLERQGKPKPKEDSWGENDLTYETYPPEIQERFNEAVLILRKAEIYAQRIDWYLSGDDGNESFLRRLEDELDELKQKTI